MSFSILVAVDCPASPGARRWLDGAAVEGPVFELRPDYTALIIVAEGLRPGPSDEDTGALLSDAEEHARDVLAFPGCRGARAGGRLAGRLTGLRGQAEAHQAQRGGTAAPGGGRAAQDRPAHRHLQRDLGPAPAAGRRGGSRQVPRAGPAGPGTQGRAVRHRARRGASHRTPRAQRGDLARRRRRDLPVLETGGSASGPGSRTPPPAPCSSSTAWLSSVLTAWRTTSRDLGGQLAVLHPGARISWRRISR